MRLSLLLLMCALTAEAANFTVPLMQGQDPQVEVKGGLFHLVQSDGCNIHLRVSSTVGGLVNATDQLVLSPGCSNLWAPEIHFLQNNWYLYYSLGNDGSAATAHRVYVAQSQTASPTGPYTIKGVLFNNFWNIDGSVFTGADGKLYFVFSGNPTGSSQNLYLAPLTNPYTLGGTPVMISQPAQPWETVGAPPGVNEGPFGFTRNGQTFIVYSASGCWTDNYCLGLLTAVGSQLLDPFAWSKTGPVFSQQPGAYGPGHNAVFVDPAGQWWNIHHADDLSGQGCGGYRQLRVQRVFWTVNNIPVFGSPVPLGSWISDSTNFLAAEFPLAETNGLTATNLAGLPSGQLRGSPVWSKPGLTFNGATDYLDAGAATGNDVQNTLTLAAWIKPSAFTDWAGIIAKGTNTEPYAMQLWHDGSLRFTGNFNSPGGAVGGGSWNSNGKLTSNQWSHVAITYDGTLLSFYLNGQLDSNQPVTTMRFGVANEPLILGADFPGAVEHFTGVIRDARVYGRALSQGELLSAAGLNLPPVLAPLTNLSMVAEQNLALQLSASDPNQPLQSLTYSLLSGPLGANVNPLSGYFTWHPALAQAPSTNLVTVKVTDNGTPPLSDTQSFTLTVRLPATPSLGSPVLNASGFGFDVSGDPGPAYAVWGASNLPGDWTLLFVTNPPVMPFHVAIPVPPGANGAFFRVQIR